MAKSNKDSVPMSNSREEVEKWLSTVGQPLELRTLKTLRDAGWTCWPAEYHSGPDGERFEIDVVGLFQAGAWRAKEQSYDRLLFALSVECKHAKAPWVIFEYPEPPGLDQWTILRDAPSLKADLHERQFHKKRKDLQTPNILAPPTVFGSRVWHVQVQKDNGKIDATDYAYEAVLQATRGAKHLVERFQKEPDPDRSIDMHRTILALPLIVIDREIVAVSLSEEEEFVFKETPLGVILWKLDMSDGHHTPVIVVTRQALPTLASDALSLAKRMESSPNPECPQCSVGFH